MTFDNQQNSHQELRSIIAEKTKKLVVWIGSGLSVDAGLPTWPDMKSRLLRHLREKANKLIPAEAQLLKSAADRAEQEDNYWVSFQIIKDRLGSSSFRSAIREALNPASTTACPKPYLCIWKLKAAGVLNLNLDRLATKAFGEVTQGRMITEFSGRDAGHYVHSLKNPYPFVANLHGIAEDASTWVLTKDTLKALLKSDGYRTFIQSCLATTTTLFLGIRADDMAVGGHIASLTNAGIDVGSHFWLTNRNDLNTDKWAEQAGIQIIQYRDHSEIIDFFDDILNYVPKEEPLPPPVVPKHQFAHEQIALPDAKSLLSMETERIRRILNTHAKKLLSPETSGSYLKYDEFRANYDEAIYRAWYTAVTINTNKLFGFTLLEEIAHGSFGRVYRAMDSDGNQVAIKVLLEEVRRDAVLLKSFRRGVRSMRFLMDRNVSGMVAYQEASEIPAFVVMNWVDGPTLYQARGQIGDWATILKIGHEMTDVIQRAHAIPERVLHRDIRPSNIMLDGFYNRPDNWRVVVLDFDLSWHLGALEQSVIHGPVAGYLAPEQIQEVPEASTRHAAVDSFGIGMTLYFMVAGKDPLPAQHRHHDWEKTVLDASSLPEKASWMSLPYRYGRLIIKATEDNQSERWDVSQIKDELGRLVDSVRNPMNVASAELFAEEIAARTNREYVWNDDRATAVINLVSGAVISISGDESARLVFANLSWSRSGKQERKKIGKWMPTASDQCVKVLVESGWKVESRNIQPQQSMVIVATLPVSMAAHTLSRQSAIFSRIAILLNFE